MFPSFSGISGYSQETLPFPCLVFPAVMRYNESKKFEEGLFMQTVIIAGVTKPEKYLNKGVAYYFRFTLPDEQAIRLKRKFFDYSQFDNFEKNLSAVQWLRMNRRCCE